MVFDTETTGLKPEEGHRVIEIGCIEIINRHKTGSTFHRYINPGREIDVEATKIHGLTNEFLVNQPSFSEIADDFVAFIRGSELIAHNASFDINFLNIELKRVNTEWEGINSCCAVIDTLQLARQRHPGQKNNLDALCKRYGIDNTRRELHGALLDSELLAEVYLAMTRGQEDLKFGITRSSYGYKKEQSYQEIHRISTDRVKLKVLEPNEEEKLAHKQWLVNHSTFSW
nr:DNA polymerase III subunit epsilon [Candidatus Nitrosacidococcus sp. I8]